MPAPLAALAANAGIGLVKDLAGDLVKGLQGSRATTTSAATPEAKAKRTADEFESMFLEHSLQRMTASTGTDGPLGENGTGGEVYRSMLVKEYAGQITRSGGVGVSAQVMSEMMRLQEGAQGSGGAHAR